MVDKMEFSVEVLRNLVKPHVDSFNFLLEPGGGLARAVRDIRPFVIEPPSKDATPIRIWLDEVTVGRPARPTTDGVLDSRLFPSECRQRALSYSAPLTATFWRQLGDSAPVSIVKVLGHIPIMVRSRACHLEHADSAELVRRHEEEREVGGYFIMNGIERCVRLLIAPRRNTALALNRNAFKNRGPLFTSLAVQMRCVRPDQSSQTLTLHSLLDGNMLVRVLLRRQEFFIPLVLLLKALLPCSDLRIFEELTRGSEDALAADRAEIMLRNFHQVHFQHLEKPDEDAAKTPTWRSDQQRAVLAYLGRLFRPVMRAPQKMPDDEVALLLLKEVVFVHVLAEDEQQVARQKFDILLHMARVLLALCSNTIKPDNADALNSQEAYLPGHLYGMILKERLQGLLDGVRAAVVKELRVRPAQAELGSDVFWRRILGRQTDVGRALEYWLKTGNLRSESGLDLMQVSGFTIVAEKLNFCRFLSHFRAIHRGAFFTEMRTTAVRKLLPEAWGFLCPVHTPDGAPCGLLNHLSAACRVLARPVLDMNQRLALVDTLRSLGVSPFSPTPKALPVLLDGVVVGFIAPERAVVAARRLRGMKVKGVAPVPSTLEIVCVPALKVGAFPSFSLYTAAGRFIRPVYSLQHTRKAKGKKKEALDARLEWIGPREQVFMEIACSARDADPSATHVEVHPRGILSVLAQLTPFSDFNQSPRNMYQCQMAKQTMGVPLHSLPYRSDNKLYRLQTGQTPIVRTREYCKHGMDEYPLGTNAVVAVISYTGYDMEDAMILNRGAMQRGFAHGSVYKYKFLDLVGKGRQSHAPTESFDNVPTEREKGRRHGDLFSDCLSKEGLPKVGTHLHQGDPLYCTLNEVTGEHHVHKFKDSEPAFVEEVRVMGHGEDGRVRRAGVKLRVNRNPILGDKFSSRHGQKGVLSVLWPQEDMPFTESGMTPDIIINPHAFPSRMTIGMLIESMAGKAGALHGHFQDASPFQFSEKNTAVEYFGRQLLQAGYHFAGNETMYSGISGEEFKVQIFLGVVYYQRLRHMVSDKSQVRATGQLNALTRQPVHGRKRGGGIRFGEMERDSLLAHGTSFLLQDRLFLSSDFSTAAVCSDCGSLLSPTTMKQGTEGTVERTMSCLNCKSSKGLRRVALPYVFLYLVNELAAMNVRLKLTIR